MKKQISQELIAQISEHIDLFYNANPFVQLLKLNVYSIEEGSVTLYMTVASEHTNFYGIAHGGSLMSIADTAMGATCLTCNKKVVTLSFNMNCIKALPEGQTVKAIGKVIHNGSRTMVCEADLIDNDNNIIAKASGTFFVIGQFCPIE